MLKSGLSRLRCVGAGARNVRTRPWRNSKVDTMHAVLVEVGAPRRPAPKILRWGGRPSLRSGLLPVPVGRFGPRAQEARIARGRRPRALIAGLRPASCSAPSGLRSMPLRFAPRQERARPYRAGRAENPRPSNRTTRGRMGRARAPRWRWVLVVGVASVFVLRIAFPPPLRT